MFELHLSLSSLQVQPQSSSESVVCLCHGKEDFHNGIKAVASLMKMLVTCWKGSPKYDNASVTALTPGRSKPPETEPFHSRPPPLTSHWSTVSDSSGTDGVFPSPSQDYTGGEWTDNCAYYRNRALQNNMPQESYGAI
uniref:Uncharacterized protein n=1 Tax=Knipowitschia caucasica TaxID=637954 RepID=A0AAV2JVB6_KNICA